MEFGPLAPVEPTARTFTASMNHFDEVHVYPGISVGARETMRGRYVPVVTVGGDRESGALPMVLPANLSFDSEREWDLMLVEDGVKLRAASLQRMKRSEGERQGNIVIQEEPLIEGLGTALLLVEFALSTSEMENSPPGVSPRLYRDSHGGQARHALYVLHEGAEVHLPQWNWNNPVKWEVLRFANGEMTRIEAAS